MHIGVKLEVDLVVPKPASLDDEPELDKEPLWVNVNSPEAEDLAIVDVEINS